MSVVVLTGCSGELGTDPDASSSASASTPSGGGGSGGGGYGVGPLGNPDGTKPGLAAIGSEADRKTARELIERVRTSGRGPKTGYERDEFGYAWMDTADGVPLARNGCDTRIISMLRTMVELFSQRMQGVVGCA
ncbi:hypothetical protein [Streptomyces sp. NPDC087525]|uniref:hypothetical protein n=1 Tax=Streptomyces sp. NPDC087525 TaxID=3365793 RepID=UPI003820E3B0